MLFNTPYYPIPTGFINATGFVSFQINSLNNFDFISINNNEIFYNNSPSEFGPPEFFDSIASFISIINSNNNIYGVLLDSGQNNIINISSTILGESGNNILLNSNNSNIVFNSNSLKGGQNLYSFLKKPAFPSNINNINLTSPLFSGRFVNKFFITGFYSGFAKGAFLEGNIDSFVGTRTFTNIWNISTGFVEFKDLVNFKSGNYINENGYYHNRNIGFTQVPIRTQISYNNELFPINNTDVVEFRIRDLNANANNITGIIFRITGGL
jgi:hypothetical protein